MNKNQSHTIGVLIPQSNAYPLIGKEFIQGLRLGLEGVEFNLCIESIAFGSDPKQLMNAVQKLIFQENVLLTTGLLGHLGLSELVEFISKNDETLLLASLGATQPVKFPEGTFLNSLGLYDSLQDLVQFLAENKYSKINTSTCYFESGYGFIESLANGIENTENITFSGHFITPHEPRENEAELMEKFISEDNPDAIIAFHNGIFAKEHASFLAQNNLHQKYPIYALPFSCDKPLIEEFTSVFNEIKPVSSWFPELENDSNKKFIDKYKNANGKTPSFFSLLGYENGLVIANALKENNPSVKAAISNASINGPRGSIHFDKVSNIASYENYLWKIDGGKKQMVTKLERHPKRVIGEPKEEDAKGWFNAYLCH